jgi:hypothetical protein
MWKVEGAGKTETVLVLVVGFLVTPVSQSQLNICNIYKYKTFNNNNNNNNNNNICLKSKKGQKLRRSVVRT